MTKILAAVLLILWALPAFAQDPVIRVFDPNVSDQIGPNTSVEFPRDNNYIDVRADGVTQHTFTWYEVGTVSAGACALQGGDDGVTFGTTIISAQTVTSSGGPTTLTAANSGFVRINCTTPISGTGYVRFVYTGLQSTSSDSVSITGDALTHLAAIETAVEDTNPVEVQPLATTSGGCEWDAVQISTAAVLERQVKATAGQVYAIYAFSLDATPVYVKLYNDTGANIDENDTPVAVFGVPANATASLGAGNNIIPVPGSQFSTAITYRVVTGIAHNSTGALTANEVVVSVCSK